MAGLAAVGCSDDHKSASASTATAASVAGSAVSATSAEVVIVDVRTPTEFAAGSVKGARNIDVEAASFDQAIASLDRKATYLVYCRSGNRSAQAAARMRAIGLTVKDGGGLADMAAAGYPFTS